MTRREVMKAAMAKGRSVQSKRVSGGGLAGLTGADGKAARGGKMGSMNAHRLSAPDSVDFYPTAPWGGRTGGEIIRMLDPWARSYWECASGSGSLAHGLADYAEAVFRSDAYDYGTGAAIYDFTSAAPPPFVADWIVSNPPFAPAEAFVRLAQKRARRGVAMLLRLGFVEGVRRYGLHYPDDWATAWPLTVKSPFSERIPILEGRYDPERSSAQAYAWFVWMNPALHPERFMARIGDRWWPATMNVPPGSKRRLTRPSDRAFAARELHPMEIAA